MEDFYIEIVTECVYCVREISPSWTLDGQLKKQKWQLKTGPFGSFSQVRQQVQIMHDAFQLVS